MTVRAIPTMTPQEIAEWERDMAARARAMNVYPVKVRAHVDPWREAYDTLWRASEQMALVLEGIERDRKMRLSDVTGALAAWRATARTSGGKPR